jgi:hypothetical protein
MRPVPMDGVGRGGGQPVGDIRPLLQALDPSLAEAQRVADAGLREWMSLAALDAIDLGEQLGMVWDDEAERRRQAVRAAFGDVDRR